MKKVFFLCWLVIPLFCVAQRFETYAGAGLGNHIEPRFNFDRTHVYAHCKTYMPKKERGKIMLSLTQYFRFSDRHAVGIEAGLSDRVWSFGDECAYDTLTKIKTNNYNNLPAEFFLLLYRYTFAPGNKYKPFAELGLGMNNFYVSTTGSDNKSIRFVRRKMAISAGAGFYFHPRWRLSGKAIFGGETPGYDVFNSFTRRREQLNSIKAQQVYVNISYRLLKF